ncbi:hypothetical protein HBE96_25085 [Clostridium sp. P21]|uniref:Uncharacterized protein n=1 Tax=Clostridium muellerianum TaxID=2716538 RepID=A0A7Y0ELY5_9CLOT|nr:DUF6557 family protein [Clostridium muellerianum]NMM65857.1 hypothetical protein [Clostridium muellerianum]
MITLKNLIDKVDFDLVWKEYIVFYPDTVNLRGKYLQMFNYLLYKEPKENMEEMIIHIDRQDYEEFDDEEDCRLELVDKEIEDIGYRVHGKNNSKEWSGYWDISAGDWGSWLGYYIHDKVTKILSAEQIVALCLYEMTWHGLSENEVINWVNNIDGNLEN